MKDTVEHNRVSHAQLFVGKEGYGTLALALAYAQEILGKENPSAVSKIQHLNHLDLHFSFPVYSEKNNSFSKRFYENFREMVLKTPYFSYNDWINSLDSEKNKQFFISADEVEDINKQFSLKSFEGGGKVFIIWCANKMNDTASNKFLKFLEEPPKNTTIILLAETEQDFMQTILSRVQITKIPRIEDGNILNYLITKHNLPEDKAESITQEAQGDLNIAMKLVETGDVTTEFEALFVQWVREAFQVKTKPEMLRNIIVWARNIAGWNREKQKSFLDYCAEIFRLAMLQNYSSEQLVYKKLSVNKFSWSKFSVYIHGANIEDILAEITAADYHLQRNANSKIVWTDLGIKLSRYIHKRI
ncbi:MAG: DNA polymerase III subunit delta' [Bergeyella zoohelcum]|nr:DNA polymerase III subunit delta' [Bergeyella zoohelcum]